MAEYNPPPLSRLAKYLAWIYTDLHPLYGQGAQFTHEDTCYWIERYIRGWHLQGVDPQHMERTEADRDVRLRNTITQEYRATFGRGTDRPRLRTPQTSSVPPTTLGGGTA